MIEFGTIKDIFCIILKDQTAGKNIIFAAGENPAAEITLDDIRNINPRWQKPKEEQGKRTKKKAEVFTPSWMCADMVRMSDAEWFGGKDPFCTVDTVNKTWEVSEDKIKFPEGKTWRDYIGRNTLEITCGEAPFVCMRYDTASGEPIETHNRVGILDRKLRVVNENTDTFYEWIVAAMKAVKSTYGYEWSGDNLVIARLNVMLTVAEWFDAKFRIALPYYYFPNFAEVISWNFWQMDGLKHTLPFSDADGSDGIYAKIMDWSDDPFKMGDVIRYADLLN